MAGPPEPPVYPFVDLRKFDYIPIDVTRFRDSKAAVVLSGDEFQAWFLLILASWHQLPAASLPDDDIELAKLAGFGRATDAWKIIREKALYGWKLCSDGRWYHPVTAEKAMIAWQGRARLVYRQRKKRAGTAVEFAQFEDWIGGYIDECHGTVTVTVPVRHRDIGVKGEREGKGEGELKGDSVLLIRADKTLENEKAAFSIFNSMAVEAGLTEAQRFTKKRQNAVRNRMAEHGGIEGWRAACEKIAMSSYLTGGGKDGWKCNLDWCLKQDRFTQIMEGVYDDNRPKSRSSKAAQDAMDILGV